MTASSRNARAYVVAILTSAIWTTVVPKAAYAIPPNGNNNTPILQYFPLESDCLPPKPTGCTDAVPNNDNYNVVIDQRIDDPVTTTTWGSWSVYPAAHPNYYPPTVPCPDSGFTVHTDTLTKQLCWTTSGALSGTVAEGLFQSLLVKVNAGIVVTLSATPCITNAFSRADTIPFEMCWETRFRYGNFKTSVSGSVRVAEVEREWACILGGEIVFQKTYCGIHTVSIIVSNSEGLQLQKAPHDTCPSTVPPADDPFDGVRSAPGCRPMDDCGTVPPGQPPCCGCGYVP